jgi:homoserine dehydrogenase
LSAAARSGFNIRSMKTVGIGMIGCGVVGGGVLKHLAANRDLIADRTGLRLEIRRIAVRDAAKARPGTDPALFTTDWRQVIADPAVDLVLELAGGTTTAREIAEAALSAGKPLITANKALLAEAGESLCDRAASKGVGIYFEASVAGGIPILKALREGLRANHIRSIHGIINGTCNYILSRMADEGGDYAEVLADAKRLGYAEADESLDVDGHDAAHKAAILASLAYGFWIRAEHVFVEGIRHVTALDVELARKFGYTLKLLATIKSDPAGPVEVRVHPTLIPDSHVLASVSGVFNAVAVEGDVVGQTLFYGRGAGPDATASAVLSDLAEAALDWSTGRKPCLPTGHNLNGRLLTVDEIITRYYLRLSVLDQPGVLAKVASVLASHQIGISSVFQPEGHEGDHVPLVLLLDYAKESKLRAATAEIARLSVVKEPVQVIRVEDFS